MTFEHERRMMPSPWLLIIWLPICAGAIWLLALIPLWGWFFIIFATIGLIYVPYYYARQLASQLARRRREEAIKLAVAGMAPIKRNMWFNREGPYQDWRCIPRSTPFEVMTDKERYRYNNAIGEFSEEKYRAVSSDYYD